MTDLDQLLARIDTTLTDCNAATLPALDVEPADPPCCDLHNQHCEVPDPLCCDACPEAIALAQFVAEHQQAAQRERQALADALTETVHKHRSGLVSWLLGRRR